MKEVEPHTTFWEAQYRRLIDAGYDYEYVEGEIIRGIRMSKESEFGENHYKRLFLKEVNIAIQEKLNPLTI